MTTYELNVDGLVGPTHNHSGLSFGNIASQTHYHQTSNPKQAALQGLEKMKVLTDLGIKQAVIPPHERPAIWMLRSVGYHGSDADILSQVAKESPKLLAACCSASSMWTANAATVSPSADSGDRRVHITPANLCSTLHRSIEPPTTSTILRAIFHDEQHFCHHDPLPANRMFADEGAANHTRLCSDHGQAGIQLFVFGRYATAKNKPQPKRFPARQTWEASQAIARLHLLEPNHTLFAQQNPNAIDAGVFHNDVVATGNQNVFLYHEETFVDTRKVIADLKTQFQQACGEELITIEVPANLISLDQAISSYLFNSQIVSLPNNTMTMIAPQECKEMTETKRFLEELLSDENNPIQKVKFFDLRESMNNGGGPACLRLRIVLTEEQLASMNTHVLLDDVLYGKLKTWIEDSYRDHLHPNDLADPALLKESQSALDKLTQILQLGSIYSFQ